MTNLILYLTIILVIGGISAIWPIAIGSAWEPTSKKTVRKMMEIAQVKQWDIIYDLGSGDGRVVVEAAKRYGAQAVGIEADPLRFLWSRFLILPLGLSKKARIIWGNFFHQSIDKASVVFLFLTQDTNQRLKAKFLRELRPGTRVVSHVWTFDGWFPVKRDTESELYLYVIGTSDQRRVGSSQQKHA